MKKCFPKTMADLHGLSTQRLLAALIYDERNLRCTNPYAPKYVELTKLANWVEHYIPDRRMHDAKID